MNNEFHHTEILDIQIELAQAQDRMPPETRQYMNRQGLERLKKALEIAKSHEVALETIVYGLGLLLEQKYFNAHEWITRARSLHERALKALTAYPSQAKPPTPTPTGEKRG